MGGFGIVAILKESGRIIASNPRHFLLLTLTLVIPLSCMALAPSFLFIQPLPDSSSPLVTPPPPVDRRKIIYISLILIFQIPLTALVTAIIIYSAYRAYLAMPHTARLTIDDEEEEDEVPKTVVIMSSIGDQEKGIRVQEEEEDLTLTLAHAFASLRFTLPRLLLTVLTVTGLYLLISVALTLLGGITLFIMISALGNDGLYYALGITFLLMPIFCCVYVHLYLRWSLSVIVATLEANTYGWQALKRSDSLSKGNHRLLFCFLVIHVVVTISLYFVEDHSSPSLFSGSYIKYARTILFIILSSFYHLYYLVVMTMIYVSCKLYHGEPLIYLNQYAKIPENDINKIY